MKFTIHWNVLDRTKKINKNNHWAAHNSWLIYDTHDMAMARNNIMLGILMFVVTPNNCICLVLMLPALITFLITLCSSCLQRECHNVCVHGMAWYIIWHCIRRINTWVWSKCFWSTEFTAWGFLWADHSHRTVCHYTLLRIFCFYIFFFYAAKKHRIRRLSMRLGMVYVCTKLSRTTTETRKIFATKNPCTMLCWAIHG